MEFMNRFLLKEKIAVVVGGASGIGESIAKAYAEAGANVIIADINESLAKNAADKIKETRKEVGVIKVDISKPNEVNDMVNNVMKKYEKIDVLVNSAGISKRMPVENLSIEDWHQIMDINLNGMFVTCQKVGIQMIKQKSGNIINIGSISGFIVNKEKTMSAYCVSKSGVHMLTKVLASEWAKYNIRVNAIAPGYVNTPLTSNLRKDSVMYEEACELTPMKRIAMPDEIASSAILLASKASSFITGHVLLVDGGYTIW